MSNVKKSLKQLKDKVFQSKQSLLVTILILGGIAGGSWRIYEHFQEPAEEVYTHFRTFDHECEIIKMGKLNDEKWMIVQYKFGKKPDNKTREHKINSFSPADVVVGKDYVATYNKEYVKPKTISIDEEQREQRTIQFELVIYKINARGRPEAYRVSLITPDRQMMPLNADYYLKGFTEEDKYLVIVGRDVYGESTLYYFEINGGKLKTERVVEEEERYQEPDEASNAEYEKYYSEEIQGKADLWPDTSAPRVYLEGLRLKTDQPNEQNRFIQKYPEIKEYYGKGTYIIINYADHDFTQEELIEDLRSGYND